MNTTAIKQNYEEIQHKVAAACERAGRAPEDVKVIAVSKTVGLTEIEQAIAAGIQRFAENRTSLFKERSVTFPQQEWHFIGAIQTNKIKDFVGRATLVHSVASEHVLRAIDKRMAAQAAQATQAGQNAQAAQATQAGQSTQTAQAAQELLRRQPVLIEVNVSGEESKDGIAPSELESLLTIAATLDYIEVKGLMTMAPISHETVIRATFKALRELRDAYASQFKKAENIDLTELSMGMTDDYEIAVEEGATVLRIGRAFWV